MVTKKTIAKVKLRIIDNLCLYIRLIAINDNLMFINWYIKLSVYIYLKLKNRFHFFISDAHSHHFEDLFAIQWVKSDTIGQNL
ncbi:hypothetical protein VIAE109791_05555 [Vibrio aestuarianus subsp. francensis]